MSEVVITEATRLETHRCWRCGRWWAYERFASGPGECPGCAARELALKEQRITDLKRSVAALRGAVSKAKARGR